MDWLQAKSFGWKLCLIALLGMATSAPLEAATKSPFRSSSKTTAKKGKKSKKLSKKRKKKPKADEKATTVTERPLEDKSKDPSFEMLLNVGLAPSPLLGFGGTLGYFLQPDLALELSFLTASGKVEPVAISAMVAGTRIRKSFGSIPYIAGGLAMRTVTAKWYTLSDGEADDEYETSSSATSIVLDAAVGAQFKLGSILLGADVGGIMYPAFKVSKTDKIPEEAYNVDDYAEQKAKFDKFNGMNLILFKVGVGIAF